MKEKVEMGRKQRKKWRQTENKENDGPMSRNLLLHLLNNNMSEIWAKVKILPPKDPQPQGKTPGSEPQPSSLLSPSPEESTIQNRDWATSQILPEHGCVLIRWRLVTRGASGVNSYVKPVSAVPQINTSISPKAPYIYPYIYIGLPQRNRENLCR